MKTTNVFSIVQLLHNCIWSCIQSGKHFCIRRHSKVSACFYLQNFVFFRWYTRRQTISLSEFFLLLCKLIHKKTNNERDKTEDRFMFQHGGPYTQFHYQSISWSWKPGKKKQHDSWKSKEEIRSQNCSSPVMPPDQHKNESRGNIKPWSLLPEGFAEAFSPS